MSKYDLLIICGLPRSGTTFLNNLFANGIFGEKYYGHHSHLHRPMGTNPISLQEPQIISHLCRLGVRIDAPLQWLTRYYQSQGRFDAVIVLKLPQLIFQCPLEEATTFQVKYIFCTRDFPDWMESFVKANGNYGITQDAMVDSHYRLYWRGDLEKPDSIEERMKHLWLMFIEKINILRNKLHPDKYCIFHYGHLKTSLIKVSEMFNQNHNAKNIGEIIDRYWRAPVT